MTVAKRKGGLGKGLDAIFAENDTDSASTAVTLKVSEIEPNRGQPRKDFDEKSMAELADSIAQHGVLQPLLVRPIPGGGYRIVAGERRWRAARMAGVTEVPAVVREMTDSEEMELALIENLQREDLNPLEEACGYKSLMDKYGMTQDDVSKTVGKSRPAVANALRLLNLPQAIQDMLSKGKISAGHARAILAFPSDALMERAAKAAAEGASVREIETMAKKANEKPKQPRADKRPHYYREVEISLKNHFGRKVRVGGGKKRGMLQIEFYGEDDLAQLVKMLGESGISSGN
ncbi:MAG TPA: stage 0 sporulation protein J [Ruminococcaceae bacterium]|nr:stage 0 sporulation protein J [Oscillospiraceae bacterium]